MLRFQAARELRGQKMYTPTCRPGRGGLIHPRSRLAEFAKYGAAFAIATVMILVPSVDVAEGQVDTAKPDSSRPTGLPGFFTTDVSGLEDSVLPLHITVGPTAPGQELLIDVSGVPSGDPFCRFG